MFDDFAEQDGLECPWLQLGRSRLPFEVPEAGLETPLGGALQRLGGEVATPHLVALVPERICAHGREPPRKRAELDPWGFGPFLAEDVYHPIQPTSLFAQVPL